MPSCDVCPPVRPFMYSVETNNHMFKFFHQSGRATPFEFFHTKRNGSFLMATAPPTGASNAGRVNNNRNSRPISGFRIDDYCSAINNISHLACPFTTHQWILCITAPAAWTTTPKRIEHNLIVCIDKSEAEVTNVLEVL